MAGEDEGSQRVMLTGRAGPPAGLIVTTGDLAGERRLYFSRLARRARRPPRRLRPLRRAWSGFTAAVETNEAVHFGTDLPSGNGLLRFESALSGTPELVALPPGRDAPPVRRLLHAGGDRLLAWCRLDDDFADSGSGLWGILLLSEDCGRSWSEIHRMTGSADEVPECIEILPLEPLRLPRPSSNGRGPQIPSVALERASQATGSSR